MDKPNNSRTVTVKISRRELVDLLIACTACSENVNDPSIKWNKLHDKLKKCLACHDLKEMLRE